MLVYTGRALSKAEKLEKMSGFLQEYVHTQYPGRFSETAHGYRVDASFGPFGIELRAELRDESQLPPERPLLVFTAHNELTAPPAQVSVFDLMQRTYIKQRTRAEVLTIAWLKNPRARFVPSDRPQVTVPAAYL